MNRSKLEIYAEERFGPPDAADEAVEVDPAPSRSRREPPRRRRRERRGGLGVLGTIKLVLMLGPMAILIGGPLVTECGRLNQSSWMPEMLHRTACARRDLTDRVSNLEGQLRAVATGFR